MNHKLNTQAQSAANNIELSTLSNMLAACLEQIQEYSDNEYVCGKSQSFHMTEIENQLNATLSKLNM